MVNVTLFNNVEPRQYDDYSLKVSTYVLWGMLHMFCGSAHDFQFFFLLFNDIHPITVCIDKVL